MSKLIKYRTVGRPKIIDDLILYKLKSAYLIGCTDAEACFAAGISTATLYNYQKQNAEFLELKDAWKLNPILKARMTLYNSLNDTKIALWYLERAIPSEFSLKYSIRKCIARYYQAVNIEYTLDNLER